MSLDKSHDKKEIREGNNSPLVGSLDQGRPKNLFQNYHSFTKLQKERGFPQKIVPRKFFFPFPVYKPNVLLLQEIMCAGRI